MKKVFGMRCGTQEVPYKQAAVIISGGSTREVPAPRHRPDPFYSSQGFGVRNCSSEFWNRAELPETL